ncbi:MAG: family 16 glycoside hydrolase, partial [Verrucomicrobiota bacterium]|nr:family 16 glycoside hydrolase [Verrucomicrobiota bacterium]
MIRLALAFLITAAWPLGPAAEELKFDFSQTKVGKRPDKFSATFLGKDDLSSPAKWQVTETRTPSSLAKENSGNNNLANSQALSQSSSSSFRKGAAICLYEGEEYGDFTFSTRLRIDSGAFKQMAGIVFRAKDAKNFFALTIDTIDKKLTLTKVVDEKQTSSWNTIGDLTIPKNEWHTLRVVCKADRFECYHNGIPINTFSDRGR